jgi:hypothetical protein
MFAATVLLLLPATLLAGGPPWLCLPVDGVTADNVQACGEKLTAALDDKIWKFGEGDRRVQILAHGKQWYLAFPMEKDVALSEVAAALKGSRFTIPRDPLRLFGHVILEIDPGQTPAKELLADLKALKYVSVAESKAKGDRLLVTVDMPYPAGNGPDRGTVGWETFERNDFSSNAATTSEPPAKAAELPSYGAFGELVARHGASLKDIRWSTVYACRVLGGVAVDDSSAATPAKKAARSAAD